MLKTRQTRFFEAAQHADLPGLQAIWEEKDLLPFNINAMAGCKTALHIVSGLGSLPCVDFLLSKGADIKVQVPGTTSAVHEAALGGHTHLLERFLDHNSACIHFVSYQFLEKNRIGHTPLYSAFFAGHAACVDLLRDKGATFDFLVFPYLVRDHCDSQGRTSHVDSGSNYLHNLAHFRLAQQIRILVPRWKLFGVNSTDNDGSTPLHYLSINRTKLGRVSYDTFIKQKTGDDDYLDTVSALLEHGANLEARDKDGLTPLLKAALVGNLPAVKALVAKGANTNAQDYKGNTALHLIIQYLSYQQLDRRDPHPSMYNVLQRIPLPAPYLDPHIFFDLSRYQTENLARQEVFAFLLTKSPDLTLRNNEGYLVQKLATNFKLNFILNLIDLHLQREACKKVQGLLHERRFTETISACQAGLNLNDSHPELLLCLAQAHQSLEQWDLALGFISRISNTFATQHATAEKLKAEINQQKEQEAQKLCKQGQEYCQLADYTKAVEFFKRAAEFTSDSEFKTQLIESKKGASLLHRCAEADSYNKTAQLLLLPNGIFTFALEELSYAFKSYPEGVSEDPEAEGENLNALQIKKELAAKLIKQIVTEAIQYFKKPLKKPCRSVRLQEHNNEIKELLNHQKLLDQFIRYYAELARAAQEEPDKFAKFKQKMVIALQPLFYLQSAKNQPGIIRVNIEKYKAFMANNALSELLMPPVDTFSEAASSTFFGETSGCADTTLNMQIAPPAPSAPLAPLF